MRNKSNIMSAEVEVVLKGAEPIRKVQQDQTNTDM